MIALLMVPAALDVHDGQLRCGAQYAGFTLGFRLKDVATNPSKHIPASWMLADQGQGSSGNVM